MIPRLFNCNCCIVLHKSPSTGCHGFRKRIDKRRVTDYLVNVLRKCHVTQWYTSWVIFPTNSSVSSLWQADYVLYNLTFTINVLPSHNHPHYALLASELHVCQAPETLTCSIWKENESENEWNNWWQSRELLHPVYCVELSFFVGRRQRPEIQYMGTNKWSLLYDWGE